MTFNFLLKETWGFQVAYVPDEVIPYDDFERAIVKGCSSKFRYFTVIGQPYHHLVGQHKAKKSTKGSIPSIGQSANEFFVQHKVCRKIDLQWGSLYHFGQ